MSYQRVAPLVRTGLSSCRNRRSLPCAPAETCMTVDRFHQPCLFTRWTSRKMHRARWGLSAPYHSASDHKGSPTTAPTRRYHCIVSTHDSTVGLADGSTAGSSRIRSLLLLPRVEGSQTFSRQPAKFGYNEQRVNESMRIGKSRAISSSSSSRGRSGLRRYAEAQATAETQLAG